jgi:hypothetical protein
MTPNAAKSPWFQPKSAFSKKIVKNRHRDHRQELPVGIKSLPYVK